MQQFVTVKEFESHVYEEAQNTISRGDREKIENALLIGISVVERYLVAYDTQAIFATPTAQKNKYIEIITYIKDIAKWHVIAGCNVTVDLELAERKYNLAIDELEKIRKGQSLPNYPKITNIPLPYEVRSGSNPKFQF